VVELRSDPSSPSLTLIALSPGPPPGPSSPFPPARLAIALRVLEMPRQVRLPQERTTGFSVFARRVV